MSAPSSSPGASASGSVQILDISYVKPSHPTQGLHLYLPSADIIFKSFGYIRDVLFYSSPGDENPSFSIPALKHGLSTALVDFYPDIRGTSLLSNQVTHFRDGGGVAIGFAASHVVFDGHSLWYFLNSWGQCCRGQGVPTPPLLVRALLKHECWLNSSEVPKVDNPPMNIVLPTHGPAKAHFKQLWHASGKESLQRKICNLIRRCAYNLQEISGFSHGEEEFQAVLDEAMKGSTKFLFLIHGSKFPVYDVDVGMGRPAAVRPSTIYSDGIVYVYPSRERGGIDICVFFASLQILNAFLAIPAPCIDI
ncbi:hypothetical protein GOP47_0011413 [Adiantum capillus-veneris]|uniref:Uncharacterized protein n=1 Tax=Adiantum capillus-veneris TaxID=13818 RepID=A0A9D4UT75_ADICA|nr:hypothetical protein GOP47_0011413 [Adiantum capillus-veneris]